MGQLHLPARAASAEDAQQWLDIFDEEFPDAEHVAHGLRRRRRHRSPTSQAFADLGLNAEGGTVMTATEVHPPPRPNTRATYRPLELRRRLGAVRRAADGVQGRRATTTTGYREFARAQGQTRRELVADGRGPVVRRLRRRPAASRRWACSRPARDSARFQSVETHPDFRGQGLAGTLVHEVSRYGFDELGAHTLVMVADPDYLAIRVYRSVGFDDTETQLQVERPLTPARSGSGDGCRGLTPSARTAGRRTSSRLRPTYRSLAG